MECSIGLVGKPSVGKSTLFSAATEKEAEEAAYPFTTVDPNVGEAYVRVDCPAPEFGESCDPSEGFCRDGTRFVPVELVDVAGLVPGAHEGRGMGNQFLTDLNETDVLVHVVDFSGETDQEGEPVEDHDPREDIRFLSEELDRWYLEVLERGMDNIEHTEDVDRVLAEQTSAFGADRHMLKRCSKGAGLGTDPEDWDREALLELASGLREETKPMIVAANKVDTDNGRENYQQISSVEEFSDLEIVPVSAHAEKALRSLVSEGKIEYTPGDESFEVVGELTEEEEVGLERISLLMEEFGGTGVQDALETAVFDTLGRIAVFPAGEGLGDRQGNVLPDCMLVPEGTTAEELAYLIHSEVGEGFLHARDLREGTRMAADQELEHGDVVRIESSR